MPPKKGPGNQPRRGRPPLTDPVSARILASDSARVAGSESASSADGDHFDTLVSLLKSAEIPPVSTHHTNTSPEVPEDISALVNILKAAEPRQRRRGLTRETTVGEIRLPDSISAIESAGLNDVARSLAAAESCTTVLIESPWANTQSVRDVISAATTRAAAVLQLLRFLKGDYTPVLTTVATSAIFQRIAQLTEPEQRLRGISLSISPIENDLSVAVDESLLSHVLLSLMLTTFTLLESVENPNVAVSIEDRRDGRCTFSIMQAHLPAPLAWSVASEDDARLRHGDALRLIALSAAHQFAQTNGGRFGAFAEECSTRFVMELPATPSLPLRSAT